MLCPALLEWDPLVELYNARTRTLPHPEAQEDRIIMTALHQGGRGDNIAMKRKP